MTSILQSSFLGFLTGSVLGGFVKSREAYLNYMENNQASTFTSHLDAKRKLQDQVGLSFAKGAFRWGWRLALFTGSYVAITTSIAVYRGKSSVIEYIAAASTAGAMYKINSGLRGITAGGILGAGLGGIAGLVSLAILKLSGTTMEEVRYWQYQWKVERDETINAAKLKNSPHEQDPLLVAHEETLAVKDIKLDSIK